MKDLFVGVISPDRKPRNPNLISELNKLTTNITVNGVYASDDFMGDKVILTPTEIACKRSHAFMYEKAKNVSNWALILEDDAEIELAKIEQVWSYIQNAEITTPHIISCYLGNWSVMKKSEQFLGGLDCIYPPDGAICYFINAEAMAVAAEEFDPIRPADWPLWSREINFVVFPGVARELKFAVSMIDSTKSREKVSWSLSNKLHEFLGLAYFHHYGINTRAVESIWYWVYRQRIAWYFPYLFKGKRSNKFLENF